MPSCVEEAVAPHSTRTSSHSIELVRETTTLVHSTTLASLLNENIISEASFPYLISFESWCRKIVFFCIVGAFKRHMFL